MLAKNQFTINVRVYLWRLYSNPLIYMSVLSVFMELSLLANCLSSWVKSPNRFSRAGGRDGGPLFQSDTPDL